MAGIVVVQALYPLVLGMVIDKAIIARRYGLTLPLIALLMGLALVRSLVMFLQNYWADRFGIRSVSDLRDAVYASLQRLPFAFYDSARTGDIMNRVTADVEAIRHFMSWGPLGILSFFATLLMGTVVGFSISVKLTLVTVLGSPVLAVMVVIFTRYNYKVHANIRETQSALGAVLQEGINGIRTIKSYTREPLQNAKVDGHSRRYVDAQRAGAKLWSLFFPAMELWAQTLALLVVGYGGWLAINGSISLGELVAYMSIQWQILGPLWGVGGHINNMTNASTATERVIELLNHKEGVQDSPAALELPRFGGHVRFEHVSFSYDGETAVLCNITLDAPPGSVTGIMGLTGAGKSSLVSLIPRFYDMTGGRVTVDGLDVRELSLGSLRSQVGVVFQETFLFSASVRDNITFGRPDATDAEVAEAARLAQAREFIASLPQGYDTVVGERGLGLSGGQKQRLAIARALLGNPRILILDDATAAVDAETEQEIQAALHAAMQGRTTFVIAHRISAVRRADWIVVLDKGSILEQGTHEHLLAAGGQYARIYDVQYADREEVAAG